MSELEKTPKEAPDIDADALVAELREEIEAEAVTVGDKPLSPPRFGKALLAPTHFSRGHIVAVALFLAWGMILLLVFARQWNRGGDGDTAVYPEPAITPLAAPPTPSLPSAPAAPELSPPLLDNDTMAPPLPNVAAPTTVALPQPVDPTAEPMPQPTYPPDPMADFP